MTIPCVQKQNLKTCILLLRFRSAFYFGRFSAYGIMQFKSLFDGDGTVGQEYEPNGMVKGVVKGVVKDVERHVTVRHADRQPIQDSKKRIHKVRSMRGKTR